MTALYCNLILNFVAFALIYVKKTLHTQFRNDTTEAQNVMEEVLNNLKKYIFFRSYDLFLLVIQYTCDRSLIFISLLLIKVIAEIWEDYLNYFLNHLKVISFIKHI